MKVTIVDYGLGNLFSVQRAFEFIGATATLTSSIDEISSASHLVLPGVGAFADGMNLINQSGLADALKNYSTNGRPFLGICLGMQLMFSRSEEYGLHEGLGLIKGTVRSIPHTANNGEMLRVPHVGWNALKRPENRESWSDTALAHTKENSSVYFVHSFHCELDDPSALVAFADYGGHRLTACVAQKSLSGCQFHPERSGPVGLEILRGFIQQA